MAYVYKDIKEGFCQAKVVSHRRFQCKVFWKRDRRSDAISPCNFDHAFRLSAIVNQAERRLADSVFPLNTREDLINAIMEAGKCSENSEAFIVSLATHLLYDPALDTPLVPLESEETAASYVRKGRGTVVTVDFANGEKMIADLDPGRIDIPQYKRTPMFTLTPVLPAVAEYLSQLTMPNVFNQKVDCIDFAEDLVDIARRSTGLGDWCDGLERLLRPVPTPINAV